MSLYMFEENASSYFDILDPEGNAISEVLYRSNAESIIGYLNAGGQQMRAGLDDGTAAVFNTQGDVVAYTPDMAAAEILVSHTNR